jgi:arginyl-tRNA synthetase
MTLMEDARFIWKKRIARALEAVAAEAGLGLAVDAADIVMEKPPSPEMGDLGFPMFVWAKALRRGPPQIAAAVAAKLTAGTAGEAAGTADALGPYINIRLNREREAALVLDRYKSGEFGRPETLSGQKIMVEFSSPNTNKPLHLGHLRNDVLGESISRILAACGAEVRKVCIVNDRGVHICKSMLAYKKYGGGRTPQSEGVKGDRFVGDWYVRFHRMAAEEPGAEEEAQEMLRAWEAGDEETRSLWKTMNGWTLEGMKATYRRTGVSFDKYYFESETYLLGKAEVQKGLDEGIFYRREDGAVAVDLEAENLGEKVLLRKDGTSIYITQDIGLAISRHRDWPFDRLVYVVGSEQNYHFRVLFSILQKLGYGWAANLYHLSYGMVNLPEGKMKSREGTVVDADDLLDSLKEMAAGEIREKEREEALGADTAETAEKIALGALHYYLIQASPGKDMLFDPKESLSFNGDTGPYLQYMGARISSMLKKAAGTEAGRAAETGGAGGELLTGDAEWEIVKVLAAYDEALAAAAAHMDPSLLAAWLYELSRAFSRFYHDCPILGAESPGLATSRLALSAAVGQALRSALDLVCIPFLEAM